MTELTNVFLLGLVYGFGSCSVTCLPYLAPYMMGSRGGFVKGITGSGAFVTGKASTYAFIAALSGLAGREFLRNPGGLRLFFGVILVAVGVSILKEKKGKACAIKTGGFLKRNGRAGVHLFSMGVVTSLVPCLPLSALLLAAAESGSALRGAAYGFIYGAGIMLSPLIIAGGFFSLISERLELERPDVKRLSVYLSSIVFISMGAIELYRAVLA